MHCSASVSLGEEREDYARTLIPWLRGICSVTVMPWENYMVLDTCCKNPITVASKGTPWLFDIPDIDSIFIHPSILPPPTSMQNCFELYIPDNKDQVIKACKTEADGRVVEGNHTVYRISAPTPEEKEEWIKCIKWVRGRGRIWEFWCSKMYWNLIDDWDGEAISFLPFPLGLQLGELGGMGRS